MAETIIISIVFGIIVAAVFSGVLIWKYKRGITSPTYEIENYTNLNLTHTEDRFINRSVTRVKVASSKKK